MEALTRALRKALWRRKCGIGIKLFYRSSKIQCLLFANEGRLFRKINVEASQELSLMFG